MEGRIHHNCNELRARLDQVLDGDCGIHEKEHFVEEIRRCPRCMDLYEKEKSFREFLQVKLSKKKVSDRLASNIRDIMRDDSGRV